ETAGGYLRVMIRLRKAWGIEDIDAPLLAETRAPIKDGYLNVVSYGAETTQPTGGAYATD
ncbi:MAG: hypothetical protein OET79_16490, partial [Nitrospirota bacterium]|nr:hypothetical protein [Nitrospirota bacterium]